MKTNRVTNQKYYLEEELTLSALEVKFAIEKYIESRDGKFQRGWNISLKSIPEINITCSKWVGFTCQKCNSLMTTKVCKIKHCQNHVCDSSDEMGKCCVCLSK